MRKINIFIAVLVMAASSCTSIEQPDLFETVSTVRLTATVEQPGNTRSVLQNDMGVLWDTAEEIKVFCEQCSEKFISSNSEPVATATFVADSTGFRLDGYSGIWAVYPYSEEASFDQTTHILTAVVPDKQTAFAGGFFRGSNVTAARSDSEDLQFFNVCGGLRFSLTSSDVRSVTFRGKNGEPLAGKVNLDLESGVPTVTKVVEASSQVTLAAPDDETFEPGQWYYIMLLPGSLSEGFTLTFDTGSGRAVYDFSKSVTVKRSVFGSIADADAGLSYNDLDNIIHFKDPVAKAACLAKFDTDGNGEITLDEAEAVTSLDGLFSDFKDVVSFDEIEYFRNVHRIDGLFFDCSKLVSITLPDNITDIGTNSFWMCTSLESVVLPSGLTSIGAQSFLMCHSLKSVNIPSGVKIIDSYAFSQCISLHEITIPEGVTEIGGNAFSNVQMRKLVLPSTIEDIGGGWLAWQHLQCCLPVIISSDNWP